MICTTTYSNKVLPAHVKKDIIAWFKSLRNYSDLHGFSYKIFQKYCMLFPNLSFCKNESHLRSKLKLSDIRFFLLKLQYIYFHDKNKDTVTIEHNNNINIPHNFILQIKSDFNKVLMLKGYICNKHSLVSSNNVKNIVVWHSLSKSCLIYSYNFIDAQSLKKLLKSLSSYYE